MRDLGAAGEQFFGGWCAAAGITANPSRRDSHGWDMLIEMSGPQALSDPVAVHEGMVESKVQIKSTDQRKGYAPIEISNLHKMATSSLPVFYILIEFDRGDIPVRAHIRHLDEVLISQILKRVTELKAKNPNVKLNNSTLRVHFPEEITPLTPGTLKALIQKHVGLTQSAYVERKIQFLKSAGFEEGAYRLQFTIPNKEQLERLIDASLGKQTSVEVEAVQGSVVRFGLSNPLPALAASTAVLSILQVVPDGNGRVIFRNKSTGLTYHFPADLYRGIINSFLPTERQTIRIDAQFLEIRIHTNGDIRGPEHSLQVNMNLQPASPVEVEDLLRAYSAFQMVRNPVDIEFGMDFFGLQSYFGMNTSDSFDDCSYQISTLKKIVDIKRHFEWSEPLLLTLEEIQPQVMRLDFHHQLFLQKQNDVVITYTPTTSPPTELEAECLYVISLKIGRYLFVEILIINGAIERADGGKNQIEGKIKKSIFKRVFNVAEEKSKIKAAVEYAISNYKSTRPIFNFAPAFFSDVLGIAHETINADTELDSPPRQS